MKALAALKKSDAEIDELSDAQLKAFVEELEGTTRLASEVLEYWLKRRDEAKGEKEAFEGVIENLVRHARRQQQNVGGGGGGKKGRRK